MNGQGKLLTHYLKNADKLIIPVYQRNYDWREEHCRKLYQDLVRTIQNKKRWHFFGGIVSVSDPMGSGLLRIRKRDLLTKLLMAW